MKSQIMFGELSYKFSLMFSWHLSLSVGLPKNPPRVHPVSSADTKLNIQCSVMPLIDIVNENKA